MSSYIFELFPKSIISEESVSSKFHSSVFLKSILGLNRQLFNTIFSIVSSVFKEQWSNNTLVRIPEISYPNVSHTKSVVELPSIMQLVKLAWLNGLALATAGATHVIKGVKSSLMWKNMG